MKMLLLNRYQWLVKPCPSTSSSPKRLYTGEEKQEEQERVAGMEVVELAHIRRDLLLSQARLRLTQAAGGLEGSLPAGPGRENVDNKELRVSQKY
jgi:hypothetical protein